MVMLRSILDATYQHSRNLAFFVPIYKSLMYLLRWIKGKENSSDSFISGIFGGCLIFGDDTPVNQQINLF
jgi:peroxisomal membrane protein 4